MKRLRGYTLIELLAVTIIIVLVVGAAVPAFTALSRSSNASLADSVLRIAVGGARDAAIQSVDGGDAAAVFFYEPGGKVTIGVYRQAGIFTDAQGRTRPVFAPDPTFEPLRLPKNFHVCGLAPAGSITSVDTIPYSWYSTERYANNTVNWVFPETEFFDDTEPEDGYVRQTFMIRFQAGTGELSLETGDALIYAPSDELDYRNDPPFNTDLNNDSFPDLRPDRSTDWRRLCRLILMAPNLTVDEQEQLIGDISSDTVLARPVREIALYDVRRLSSQVRSAGVSGFKGINNATGCLYSMESGTKHPVLDKVVSAKASEKLPLVADIFVVDRYSGALNRLLRAEGVEP